jgi:hypothetical protein
MMQQELAVNAPGSDGTGQPSQVDGQDWRLSIKALSNVDSDLPLTHERQMKSGLSDRWNTAIHPVRI